MEDVVQWAEYLPASTKPWVHPCNWETGSGKLEVHSHSLLYHKICSHYGLHDTLSSKKK